jgi:hypothetical protein
MLTKVSIGIGYISFFFEKDYIAFPSCSFEDYKKGIHIGNQGVIWLTGSVDLKEEIGEACERINTSLKNDILEEVLITTGKYVTPVDIEGIQNKWAKPHDLDCRLIRRLEELMIEKELTDARQRRIEALINKKTL